MQPSLELTPLDASFGAVVTGPKLAELDDATFAALYRAWLDHALLIFPGQHLTRAEQIAFARRFGAPEFEIAGFSPAAAHHVGEEVGLPGRVDGWVSTAKELGAE